jgi:hypothetical protein
MDGARRSTRIARRNPTVDVAGMCRSPSQHQLRTVITTMLIRVDANPGDISTEASGSSSRVATDPSVPPTDGTCHFMKLPTELRLTFAEHIFEDFFTRLTLGLYPPFFMNGESRLPYTQELFSVLHVNRAFRLESIELEHV